MACSEYIFKFSEERESFVPFLVLKYFIKVSLTKPLCSKHHAIFNTVSNFEFSDVSHRGHLGEEGWR